MRRIVITLICISTALPAYAIRVQCAAQWHGDAYSNAQIYDGPLSDKAILTPDETGKTNAEGDAIFSNRYTLAYIYTAHRRVHVGCEYQGGAMKDIALTKPIKTCAIIKTTPFALDCH